MNIDEMQAGREMDKAIGEKIFGYWVYSYDKDYFDNCYCMLMDGSGDSIVSGLCAGERKNEEEAWEDCPNFSTDIRDAWEVIDELFPEWSYCINYLNNWRHRNTHHCSFARLPDGTSKENAIYVTGSEKTVINGYADTVPLAICRAALKVVTPNEP